MAGKKKTREQLQILFSRVMFWLQDIPLIAFYGTLLGIIRESNLIEGDDDIDVIVHKSYREKIISKLSKSNLRITINQPSILQIYDKDIGPFDIYFYEDIGNDILLKWDGNLLYRKNNIFPLLSQQFYGYTIYIPHNSNHILQETYGEKWHIPALKESYNWAMINYVRKQSK
jgi:phosphorylcholine metabolism protein LicD